MKAQITLHLVGFLLVGLLDSFGQATFTKITTVNDGGFSGSVSWGDYDNDGFIDLFVANYGVKNFLYRNSGNGTFAKITAGDMVNDIGTSFGGVWGDYDNDGYLDLFVVNEVGTNFFYRNNGDGTFAAIRTGKIVTEAGDHSSAVWGDYDNDGWLDLFVARGGALGTNSRHDGLYRNNGDGTFSKATHSALVMDDAIAQGAAWGDYDNDGRLDLFVTTYFWNTFPFADNLLYHNEGYGTFRRVTSSPVVNDGQAINHGCAWGDYDNDGFLDLFVANNSAGNGGGNFLFHNNGDGSFTRITNGAAVAGGYDSIDCAWGDFDNDGFLDLFVANRGGGNRLYHNSGDGTFSRITTGVVATDIAQTVGCAWGDYDNDGFLDLFVGNGFDTPQINFLYRNNGNSNAWIVLKLVGAPSNRAAIGAKVRLRAVIGGTPRWQLREISGGFSYGSQNDLRAHFGLGDATNIDLVRIEWPSGTVQTITHLAVNQILTVIELPRLEVVGATNGLFHFLLQGGRGFRYDIEVSSNLTSWMPLVTVTNLAATTEITDSIATSQRFYRARWSGP